ncbi:hypothetical protein DL765_002424 [Monosporascus sp. GIB2]|nr:hypothetical protein DL765_002424 [Monosporascus sp. GIB2]
MSNQEFHNPLPRGEMARLASTREQPITDSVKSTDKFQKAFPDINWKGAVIEPTVNMAFGLRSFWEARECLVGHPDILKQFDAVYIRDDHPVSVMLKQLYEALKLKAAMLEKMGSDSGPKVAAGASVGQNEGTVKRRTGDDMGV